MRWEQIEPICIVFISSSWFKNKSTDDCVQYTDLDNTLYYHYCILLLPYCAFEPWTEVITLWQGWMNLCGTSGALTPWHLRPNPPPLDEVKHYYKAFHKAQLELARPEGLLVGECLEDEHQENPQNNCKESRESLVDKQANEVLAKREESLLVKVKQLEEEKTCLRERLFFFWSSLFYSCNMKEGTEKSERM